MPTFHPPVYSKHTDASNGNIESCYTFTIDFTKDEDGITIVADNESSLSAPSLQSAITEHQEWWTTFLKNFMQASSKLFAKPYTVEQVNKITKHIFNGTIDTQFPSTVLLLPKTIKIRAGIFWVKWDYLCEPLMIDIPALPEEESSIQISSILPDLANVTDDVEEFNLDEVPMDKNATDSHFEISNSNRLYDKQKVKEAKLKAKLALYKAQSKMRMYYDKYGNEVSDSESDSEEESEEDEDDEEEVQL
jgi:hypothetical protein